MFTLSILQRSWPVMIVICSVFSWPPYITQGVWASMLEDRCFLDSFLSENQRRLAENHLLATSFFDEHGIGYFKGRLVSLRVFNIISLRFVHVIMLTTFFFTYMDHKLHFYSLLLPVMPACSSGSTCAHTFHPVTNPQSSKGKPRSCQRAPKTVYSSVTEVISSQRKLDGFG
jgi:hypothetical protein